MAQVGMQPGWEIVLDPQSLSAKSQRFLQAMAEAAPAGSVVNKSYRASRQRLMLYGPGSEANMRTIELHKRRGGRVAMWDMGYWDRTESMRLSLDSMHPTAEQLFLSPSDGRGREFLLRSDAIESGPILLVGLGAKSVSAYGLGHTMRWETAMADQIRQRFPGRPIWWRPKGRKVVRMGGTVLKHGMPIEDALKGCSLVVCRHSNVAVDACIAGIPVQCEDGAAYALYRGRPAPGVQDRLEFLRRLSWWNWSPSEASGAWHWLETIEGKTRRAQK